MFLFCVYLQVLPSWPSPFYVPLSPLFCPPNTHVPVHMYSSPVRPMNASMKSSSIIRERNVFSFLREFMLFIFRLSDSKTKLCLGHKKPILVIGIPWWFTTQNLLSNTEAGDSQRLNNQLWVTMWILFNDNKTTSVNSIIYCIVESWPVAVNTTAPRPTFVMCCSVTKKDTHSCIFVNIYESNLIMSLSKKVV